MSAIVKGVGDLVASVVEIFKGLIEGIFTLIQTAFSTVASLIGSFFDLFQGLIGFILGKFISNTTLWSSIPEKLTCRRQHFHYRNAGRGLLCLCVVPSSTGQIGNTFGGSEEAQVKQESMAVHNCEGHEIWRRSRQRLG